MARIRQSQSRWYSKARARATAVLCVDSASATAKSATGRLSRQAFYTTSAVGTNIGRSTGCAPFASTLRPNLTGGALNRTAAGYSLGGGSARGARHFSHSPASPAQVVQDVSQGVRAFLLAGHQAQFNGISSTTREKRYKTVTALQATTMRKLQVVPAGTPGSKVIFDINPTITAVADMKGVTGYDKNAETHVNSTGLLEGLSIDFSRSLQDLAAILQDIKRLCELGDLPLTYQDDQLWIHFPGCDAATVETLCLDNGVQRGRIKQDANFDAFVGADVALMYPFAPSAGNTRPSSVLEHANEPTELSWADMLSTNTISDRDSALSDMQLYNEARSPVHSQDWMSGRSYASTQEFEYREHSPLEYQGVEGIYRFIQQCDAARA